MYIIIMFDCLDNCYISHLYATNCMVNFGTLSLHIYFPLHDIIPDLTWCREENVKRCIDVFKN